MLAGARSQTWFCYPRAGPAGMSWGLWAGPLLPRPGRRGRGRPQHPLHPVPAGVASVVVSFFLSMYYNVINAWAFWYLFHSFQVSAPEQGSERERGRATECTLPAHGWSVGAAALRESGAIRKWCEGLGVAGRPQSSGGLLSQGSMDPCCCV